MSNLSELNAHLFDALKRLGSPDMTPEQIDAEVKRSNAIVGSEDMTTCPCGCNSLVTLWSGSPRTYRIACPACTRTTARQPTEADAVALWEEYATGRRAMA